LTHQHAFINLKYILNLFLKYFTFESVIKYAGKLFSLLFPTSFRFYEKSADVLKCKWKNSTDTKERWPFPRSILNLRWTPIPSNPFLPPVSPFPLVRRASPRKSSPLISIISAWMHARVPLTRTATSGFWKKPKKRFTMAHHFAVLHSQARERVHCIVVNYGYQYDPESRGGPNGIILRYYITSGGEYNAAIQLIQCVV